MTKKKKKILNEYFELGLRALLPPAVTTAMLNKVSF